MRKVIINTTPIIALSEIGELSLLKSLYEEVVIPKAVFEEIKTEPGFTEVRECDWIHVENVKDDSKRGLFQSRLHKGEVEVMMLAMETNADLVVIDDALARKTARYYEMTITGTLGILIKAKEKGLVDSVDKLMTRLISNGLYVSEDVRLAVLKEAGEA